MKKTFKFRLYPNKTQKLILEQSLNTCRILYNNALEERKEAWGNEKHSVNYHEQSTALPLKKAKNPFLPKVHSQVLQDVLRRVDKSFKNFFRRVKKGEKVGYPRFKGNDRYDSFTYPQSGFSIEGKKLKLAKIGEINIKLHRELQDAKVKTCVIKRDIDRWYACFSVELLNSQDKHEIINAVGMDVGLKSLVTLSDGTKIEPPKFLRKSEEKLAIEQRKLSKKQKGTHNRAKQRTIVAKLHRKIREQRTDFNHKLSRQFVNSYDLIAFEDLHIKNMLGNRHLAKSISDASWNQLQTFTAYKAEYAGKLVKFVVPNGTSQECSNCGAIMQLSLADRTFRCSNCGLIKDRDHNSAINILNRALVGLEQPVTVGDFSIEKSVNQEATLLVRW